MIGEERRQRLLAALRQAESISVAEASARLKVSRMTVHRDLDRLAAAGLARKVHGGAVPVPAPAGDSRLAMPFRERRAVHAVAKLRIARHLARLLVGARTLAFDDSSTVFGLAQALRPPSRGADLFVLTNGIALFQELRRRGAGFRVALTGGEPHPRTDSLVGPLAVKGLEGLRFDAAVVSAAGVFPGEGLVYDSTPEESAIKQAFLARASRRILAVDRSKFDQPAPYLLGKLGEFDVLVTEEGPRQLGRRHAR